MKHQTETFSSPQHLLIPPDTSSFLERLNAVEEELDCGPAYHYEQVRLFVRPSVRLFLPVCLYQFFFCLPLQCLDRKCDDDGHGNPGGLASRTRSKLPLVDVPLVQLEAELLPPDTTADMYEQKGAVEDRHWAAWLQGLVTLDNEGAPCVKSKVTTSRWRSAFSTLLLVVLAEEAEDEDDPEYNFLEDLDEPDLEDYRTDRAVQITSRSQEQVQVQFRGVGTSTLISHSLYLSVFSREGGE